LYLNSPGVIARGREGQELPESELKALVSRLPLLSLAWAIGTCLPEERFASSFPAPKFGEIARPLFLRQVHGYEPAKHVNGGAVVAELHLNALRPSYSHDPLLDLWRAEVG
jgi:hypothetical protein